MLHTLTNELRLIADNQAGVRPAASYGTSVTAGYNAYGAYVALLSATSEDSDWVEININSIGTSATATDTLVTIGVDSAGGTSYTDLIPHLLATAAGGYASSSAPGGIWYRFPLRITAGSTLGVKASQNNASQIDGNVLVRLYRQSRPDVGPRIGSYVRTFGEVTATSKGTDVTTGAPSDGAWTQLGGALTADDNLFFWQVGMGLNTNVFSASTIHLDMGIGDGTNFRTPILDVPACLASAEQLRADFHGAYAEAVAGDKIYARAQDSTGAVTISMIAYGVGG